MTPKIFEVDINPYILKWARESVGIKKEAVSNKIKKPIEFLNDLETGKSKPTLGVLRELSKYYKRPLAVFFLSEIPKEPPIPEDFRTLPDIDSAPLSKKTYLAIRKARRLSSIAYELVDEIGLGIKLETNNINLNDNPEEIAIIERKRFNVNIHEQINWNDENVAFKNWRDVLSKFNILVFQFQIPLEELRGFSIFGKGLPVIGLSSYDWIGARIFTIFHEYAHFLLGEEGICIPSEEILKEGKSNKEKIESFCNNFSEAFLVPKSFLLNDEAIRKLKSNSNMLSNSIIQLSRKYKVSRYVILYRLLHLEIISRNQFNRNIDRLFSEERKEIKRGYDRIVARKPLTKYGSFFTSLILESKNKGLITLSDSLDYLSIKLKHIEKLESLIFGF